MEDKFGTRELVGRYLQTLPDTTSYKIKTYLDREDVYIYEEKINKPLVEMNSEEVYDMFLSFRNTKFTTSEKGKKPFRMSIRTYQMLVSIYRIFFDWYIDNVKVIKNPLNDKRLSGGNLIARLNEGREVFDKEKLENIIKQIHVEKEEFYAKYCECILRMFYEGFASAKEIVLLKEENISHRRKIVSLQGKIIKLSDRLYQLLVELHNWESVEMQRGKYVLVSWNDSYFKFLTREKKVTDFAKKDIYGITTIVMRYVSKNIRDEMGIDIDTDTIYYRGFYDFLVDKYDENYAIKLVKAVRSPEHTKVLLNCALEYGVGDTNVTILKRKLQPFITA